MHNSLSFSCFLFYLICTWKLRKNCVGHFFYSRRQLTDHFDGESLPQLRRAAARDCVESGDANRLKDGGCEPTKRPGDANRLKDLP